MNPMSSGHPGPEWAFTMFSMTSQLLQGDQGPDELLRSVADTVVCSAIEVDAPQHFRGYPWQVADRKPGAGEWEDFRALADSLGVRPTLLGIYGDPALRRESLLSLDESVDYIDGQLAAAAAMGFEGTRIAFGLAPELLGPLADCAERHGVSLLQEVQGGLRPDSESFQQQVQAVDGIGSPALGFVFDLSACTPELPVTYLTALRREGVPLEAVDYLEADWPDSTPDSLKAGLEHRLSGVDLARGARARLSMVFGRFGNTRVADWRELLPSVRGVHLKYWDLDDAGGRVSKPMAELGQELHVAGYRGALTSEWGGHEWLPDDPITMANGHRRLYERVAALHSLDAPKASETSGRSVSNERKRS